MWDYYLSLKITKSIILTLQHFYIIINTQYKISPIVFECNNKIVTQKSVVREYLEGRGVRVEPSALYTQDQNGGAERLRGVIKDRIRAMGTLFLNELWPEIYKAVVYLANKTPWYSLQWKMPYKKFFNTPLLSYYLRAYGYKVFVLIITALITFKRL